MLPRSVRAKAAIVWRIQQATRTLLGRVLSEWGYWRTLVENLPVDKKGHPLPWYSYPAIHYLESLDFSKSSVLEWGGGHSTYFWGRRAKSVTTIEHNQAWAERISESLDSLPVQIIFLDEPRTYIDLPPFLDEQSFDLIIIDGLYRADCARTAVKRLAPGGVVVLDDSDWYPKTCAWLRSQGLIQIDFDGMTPTAWTTSTTSLFLDRNFAPTPVFEELPGPSRAGLVRRFDDDSLVGTAGERD